MSDQMLELKAIEERRAYMREWRSNNKDKIKEHQKRYWLKKAKKRIDEENA